jgi:DNA repair exonuclease SbcCD ATPase subunit
LRQSNIDLQKTIANLNIDARIAELNNQHTTLYNEYNSHSARWSELQPFVVNMPTEIETASVGYEDKKRLEMEKSIELNSTIKKMTSTSCVSCKRVYDNMEEVIKTATQDKINIESSLVEIRNQISSQKSEIDRVVLSHTQINNEINDITRKLNTINFSINNIISTKEKVAGESVASEAVITENNKNIEIHQGKINDLTTKNTELKEEVSLKSRDLSYYNELCKIFSFYGIRSFLLFNDIDFVNDKLREYSAQLYTDMMIQLKSNIDEKTGSLSSLDLVAIVNNREREFTKLSGGERRRGDIAIQLAIKELIKYVYRVDTNLNTIDEITDGLDSPGKSSTLELILQTTAPDSSTYVISHEHLNINAKSITIIKENGKSRLNTSL